MPVPVEIDFASFDAVARAAASGGAESNATLVVFAGEDLAFGRATTPIVAPALKAIERAARAAKFKGRAGMALDLLGPEKLAVDRLVVVGTARSEDRDEDVAASERVSLGGTVSGQVGRSAKTLVLFEMPDGTGDAAAAADFALGARLRAYKFDLYRTRQKDEDKSAEARLTIGVAAPDAASQAYAPLAAVAGGVEFARTLVNEPPNILYPEEFANRTHALTKLGVSVEILDEPALRGLGMGALLGVGQGSARESRVVIMRWNGAGDGKPVAFVGKGVCFDTGGISIKPAAGMEDMKGDMAGAACVVGLMQALAARKAKVNAIGAIGLVENMPGPNAQRPGDIVKSMSGQTIEIINTDAEGRLVLADVLHYVQDRFKPKFMIDLATLTGAIMVALGTDYAGLFSNNDELAQRLTEAGRESGEKVWRLPLGRAYDKLIDSKFADMKNTGGRHGGSITAAQFLQRFVNKTPWAHLDIAGTGMGAPLTEINQSWGSGFGVRLLDRLVRDHYES
jgi:leucyl aminopeptidase